MSRRWLQDRKKDHYYKMAKRDNYRSRAAYKLSQIDARFGIFRPGDMVIDLGASPGGWSQVAAERVGDSGTVIALDIKPIEPITGVIIVRGDARSKVTKRKVGELLPGGVASVVISDMAPNISGNYSLDHARSIELADMALEFADKFLKAGGNMVVKVFDGDMAKDYYSRMGERFLAAKRHSPKASRKSSSEIYMVGKSRI